MRTRKGDNEAVATPTLAEALVGTPYSVDETGAEDAGVRDTVARRMVAFQDRSADLARAYASDGLRPLREVHRVRGVYESNALEGLGLDLVGTEQAMRASGEHAREAVRRSMATALALDRHTLEVVGLQEACRIADVIADSRSEPVTEADLRGLHRIILGDDPAGGIYKRYVNQISGSAHQPPAPSDVPAHMRDLAAWLSVPAVPPVLQAAVAHAWLTHIHPFEDGNGRMARLLANLVLARAGYPPVIVKAAAHRIAYLDALAASDHGGDLLPLVNTFSQLLKGSFRQVEHPRATLRLWSRLLRQEQPSPFLRWQDRVDGFLAGVAGGLERQFALIRGGRLDIEDYEQLVRGGVLIAPRLAKITYGPDLTVEVLVVASPPPRGAAGLGTGRHPVLRFLYRTDDPRDPKQHRRLGPGRGFPYDEVCLEPEALPGAVLRGRAERRTTPAGAGEAVAAEVAAWASAPRRRGAGDLLLARDVLGRGADQGKSEPQRSPRTRFQRGVW
jgi:Fic family protein